MKKKCRKCNQEKLLEQFGFQKRNNDGRQSYCKECNLQVQKESKLKNKKEYWHQDGYMTEKEHFNSALEQYAKVFGMPELLKHKR